MKDARRRPAPLLTGDFAAHLALATGARRRIHDGETKTECEEELIGMRSMSSPELFTIPPVFTLPDKSKDDKESSDGSDDSSSDEDDGEVVEFHSEGYGLGAPSPRHAPKARSKTMQKMREQAVERVAQMAGDYCEALLRNQEAADELKSGRNRSAPSSVNPADFGAMIRPVRRGAVPVPTDDSDESDGGYKPQIQAPTIVFNMGKVEKNTVIVLDWDDTLLPTGFIKDNLWSSLPYDDRYKAVDPDSTYYKTLSAHAQKVADTLTAACRVAHVVIVTLAVKPWVSNSAEWYMPGVAMQELFDKYNIQVYYARDHLRKRAATKAQKDAGFDIFTLAKARAMSKGLKVLKMGRARPNESPGYRNVISVGDSVIEREALHTVMWDYDERLETEPCCKTVKLMDDPSVEHLGMQLNLLNAWLPRMVQHQGDFDISMEGPNDLDNAAKRIFENSHQ